MVQEIKFPRQPHYFKNVTNPLMVTLAIMLAIWLIKVLWGRRKLYLYSRKIQGPLAFPLIGSLYKFIGNTEDIMNALIKLQSSNSDLVKFWFGPKLIIMVSKPEYIAEILTHPSCFNKDDLYGFIVKIVGTGLMTAPDFKWKKTRRIVSPAFNQRILDSFVPIMGQQARVLIDQLEKHVGEKDFDIFTSVSYCTLDIICETAMGVQMKAQTTDSEFAHQLDRMMEVCALRIFHVWYHYEPLFNLLPLAKEYKKCINSFRSFCMEVIKKKVNEHQQKLTYHESGIAADNEEGGPKKIKAFLDLILESSQFSEERLEEEVDIFIVAGTDTTATALSAFFLCMGMFPDIQEKVYQEIVNEIGQDRPVEPSDLSKFKYTEMTIKEVLRVFPTVPFYLRKLGDDVDLGDVILPKGSSAFFGTIPHHRNPKYWEDPLKFDPERFLPENVAKRHPCTYIPFSYGARNCIGGRYAMMNMKTIIANVLRRYRLTSSYKSIEDVPLATSIMLRFSNGTKLTIHER